MTALENWEEATRAGQEMRRLFPDAVVLPYAENCAIEPYNFMKTKDLLVMLEEIKAHRDVADHLRAGKDGAQGWVPEVQDARAFIAADWAVRGQLAGRSRLFCKQVRPEGGQR